MAVEAAPILHANQMTPQEAAFLHPFHWGGRTVGASEVSRLPVAHIGAKVIKLSFSDWAKEVALQRLRSGVTTPDRYRIFGPGQQITPAEHYGKLIVFDQSILISRGEPYTVDPTELPKYPPFAIPQQVADVKPMCVQEPHLRYLREPAQVARVTEGGEDKNIMQTSMERHVGWREYGTQVGVLTMPETVEIGAVSHYVVDSADGKQVGHDMLTITHNALVLPNPLTSQA